MNKVNFILTVAIASCILYSCSPKSYCFFNTKERTIYIADKKTDSIKTIYINSENPSLGLKKVINLTTASKSFKISGDSIIHQSVNISLTTNNQNRYSLKLKEEDWSKDTIFKCRYLIR